MSEDISSLTASPKCLVDNSPFKDSFKSEMSSSDTNKSEFLVTLN